VIVSVLCLSLPCVPATARCPHSPFRFLRLPLRSRPQRFPCHDEEQVQGTAQLGCRVCDVHDFKQLPNSPVGTASLDTTSKRIPSKAEAEFLPNEQSTSRYPFSRGFRDGMLMVLDAGCSKRPGGHGRTTEKGREFQRADALDFYPPRWVLHDPCIGPYVCHCNGHDYPDYCVQGGHRLGQHSRRREENPILQDP
jgi:hypothetical protein